MASLGIYTVYDDKELEVLTARCRRDIFSSYLKYESSMTRDNPVIYQEIIVGEEYGVDVVNDLDGRFVASFPKQKISMRSGETDLGKTANPSPVINLSKTISQNSCHKGLLSVDCIKNESGIYVIEMNCRISGHYPLSYLAGFNYPQLLINWLKGEKTDEKLLNFEEGVYVVKDLVPTILYSEHR